MVFLPSTKTASNERTHVPAANAVNGTEPRITGAVVDEVNVSVLLIHLLLQYQQQVKRALFVFITLNYIFSYGAQDNLIY